MAGKFMNTHYFDTQDKVIGMTEELIQNPMYLFNDKKGTKAKYYNTNKEKSMLDPGSKLGYSQLGKNSPFRYNIINGLYLYQFPRVEFNFNDDEFGLANEPVEGESYILPNIFQPYEGDFFEVPGLKDSTWLFKVDNVQVDTFENGANAYKIHWVLDRTDHSEIINQVVESFRYINTVDGTNLKAVVRSDKYELAKKLEEISLTLSTYFYEIFYSPNVQTFVYPWTNMATMYDPFAIEFMIRNSVFSDKQEQVYVMHQMMRPSTFSIEYNRSFLRAFEMRDIERLKESTISSQADYISDVTSVFYTRFENYFSLSYKVYEGTPGEVISLLDEELIHRIIYNEKYYEKEFQYKNLFISYFKHEAISYNDVSDLELFYEIERLDDPKDMFYQLLLLIFIIDQYTIELLS